VCRHMGKHLFERPYCFVPHSKVDLRECQPACMLRLCFDVCICHSTLIVSAHCSEVPARMEAVPEGGMHVRTPRILAKEVADLRLVIFDLTSCAALVTRVATAGETDDRAPSCLIFDSGW